MTRDARTVTRRARALAARRETQVWILANLAECLALSAGRVPPVIRRQAARAAEDGAPAPGRDVRSKRGTG
jgi:hypothetical protein